MLFPEIITRNLRNFDFAKLPLISKTSMQTSLHGEHFNLPGHELYHLKVSVLEKVWDLGRSLLEVRESKYIRDFMTEFRGINTKKIVFT